MRLLSRVHVTVLLLAAAPLHLAAQQQAIGLDTPLPIDPRVTVGELDNGLRYYIRANQRPENRAELRLVVNAGSVLEDDDQRGLAHFVEHMAFNGTRNFERQELVRYLESIGMRFGPDLNAYTSFDETVYMLTIPTDSPPVVATAFQILEDWATGLLFDPEEIEKERGVVIEEWRARRGAGARLTDLQIPVLLHDSRYAERLPIGVRETLESFPHEALIRFYEDWYRPDLMAVVAVGDFDPAEIEALIVRHFGHVPPAVEPRERPLFPVPEHERTLFHAATDPELTTTRVEVLHKLPPRSVASIADYRRTLVERLYNGMLNARFAEITQRSNAPFLGAYSSHGGFVRSTDAYSLGAVVPDGGVERGLEAVLVEAQRVERHGFTDTELARARLNLLRGLERAHAERERTNSGAYASAYVAHFLQGEPIPGITFEFELAQLLVPDISLEEVEAAAREWISEGNRVILVSAPENDAVALPGEPELRRVLAIAEAADVEPYVDAVTDQPLLAALPEPAPIIEERTHEGVEVLEWRLANGVRVLLRATDFRDDEIVLQGFAPGGLSLASDEEYLSASFAADMVRSSGVGPYRMVELQRALAGQAVGIAPFISEIEQGVTGSASPSDVETLFQLVYLHFTEPRHDEEAVGALLERLDALLANRSADPNAAFSDTLQVTLSQYHPRARPLTRELVAELDVQLAHDFYRERFADASDFTFVLVGNLDVDALRPLVQRYLGGLPTTGRADTWRDNGIRPPQGVVEKVVRRGLEPQSTTRLVFSGSLDFSRENSHAMRSLANALEIRLREILREDLGGTYGVQVGASPFRIPEARYTFSIGFGADPERLDELVDVVFAEIERIQREGITEDELLRVREIQRRSRETSLRQNGYWLSQLVSYAREGEDFADILTYERLIDGLTADDVRDAARAWLNVENYVRVSLFPADPR